MNDGFRQFALRAMRGEAGALGAAARLGLWAVEPFYAGAMTIRNSMYQRGGGESVGIPVISVGNITTGGTGKTPVVRRLAEEFRGRGHALAILMRGYRQGASAVSDEQAMLDSQLNSAGQAKVIVEANPDRIAGARSVLAQSPATDLFILDDGFQHRRMKRDFDLVLVDATEPFGYGHVLPRGLLREPLSGLGRADAILVTRARQASAQRLAEIHGQLRRYNATAPIYQVDHAIAGFLGESREERVDGRKVFAFAGIGNPESLAAKLREQTTLVGSRWFGDHHHYSQQDLDEVLKEGAARGAEYVVTTEKDWPKISGLSRGSGPGIIRAKLELRFLNEDDRHLLKQINERMKWPVESVAAGARR